MAPNETSHSEDRKGSQTPTPLELGPHQRIIPSYEELKHRVLKLADYEGNYELWQTPIREGASLEALSEQHRLLTEYWRESPESRSFKELFVEVILKQEKLMVSSGMCLGLGA